VTQDNRGKKTAGVDGMKSLSPAGRLRLVSILNIKTKAKPLRRIWIPKPNTDEKRPLGIPVLHDRATQALVKLALEPEWEGRFEPNSYGFRPGRSAHDAREAIFLGIRNKPKYVLDADIAKCFDRIDHIALLKKIHTFPTMRRVIRGWLKAGVMDGPDLFPTITGTPQGGVVSPLLANIALHGLETTIRQYFPQTCKVNGKTVGEWQPIVIRYADDFVILHEDRRIVEEAQQKTAEWLQELGLDLKPSKTRITHTLNKTEEGHVGFDFLGWTIRQHPVGKYHTGKNTHGRPLGFKTIIAPSKEAQKRHQAQLAEIIGRHRSATQHNLILKLNRVIRGWVNYHSTSVASRAFHSMERHLLLKLLTWARRRHPRKAAAWIAKRYWHLDGHPKWDFHVTNGPRLYRHTDKAITRHAKVRGHKSPFDGDWVYWATRLGRQPDLSTEVASLLRKQHGRCTWCGLYFTNTDLRERDHIIPQQRRLRVGWSEKQLLHGHCHDRKTVLDGSTTRGTTDKDGGVCAPVVQPHD
jgi:RNA-directed DNA polymerase